MKKLIKQVNFFFVSVIVLIIAIFVTESTGDPLLQKGDLINVAHADAAGGGTYGDGDGCGGDGGI